MRKKHVLLTNKPLPLGKSKSPGVEEKRVNWTHPCLVDLAGPPRRTQLATGPKKTTKHAGKHVNPEECQTSRKACQTPRKACQTPIKVCQTPRKVSNTQRSMSDTQKSVSKTQKIVKHLKKACQIPRKCVKCIKPTGKYIKGMKHTQRHMKNTHIEDQCVTKMRLKVRHEHVTVTCHTMNM